MRKLGLLVFIAAIISCTNNATTQSESADSSYHAITDSSRVTKDSLAIPDSSSPNLAH